MPTSTTSITDRPTLRFTQTIDSAIVRVRWEFVDDTLSFTQSTIRRGAWAACFSAISRRRTIVLIRQCAVCVRCHLRRGKIEHQTGSPPGIFAQEDKRRFLQNVFCFVHRRVHGRAIMFPARRVCRCRPGRSRCATGWPALPLLKF